MMKLSEASTAMQGHLNGSDGCFQSVEIDTRRLEKGALYFAIHGERNNGHDYIDQAIQAGAAASVADELFLESQSTRHIRVGDTTIALGMLAAHWREQFSVPVIGITGSNGKTTVCKIVSGLFAETIPGITPQGSFNNHWGVPLTLLKLRERHQSAVIEMGMNHAGELSYLGKIVKPTIALITNAAAAHLEGLKTIEGVAQAKGELIDFVEQNGTVVLNRDDAFYWQWKTRAGNRKCVNFGEHADADVRVLLAAGTRLELSVHGEKAIFDFPLIGQHNSLNAAAAVAVAIAAGVPLEAIKAGLKKIRAVPGRLNVLQIAPDFILIDDSYNANQASMLAAIDVLAEQAGKKILALGAMGELGAGSSKIHHDIAFYAKQKGIDNLLTLVERDDANYLQDMAACLEGFGTGSAAFSTVQGLTTKIISLSGAKTILVKGSRLARMERLIETLRNTGGALC